MQEITIKPNQIVTSHDDVVVTITESIPQPVITREEKKTIKEIRNRIKSINEDIDNLKAERLSLQTLLDTVKPELDKISL